MARNDDTIVAPGVIRTDCKWGYILQGTRDALVASGLADVAWFAEGERDKRGRIIRRKHFTIGERRVMTVCPARGRCRVLTHYAKAEQRAAEFRRELKKAKECEANALAALPDSHERFREKSIESVEWFLGYVCHFIGQSRGGYRFSPETVTAFGILASNMLQTLHQARSTFDRNARQECTNEIHALSAKLDPGLRKFLDGLDL